ncbi:MAG: Fatty acid desaturase [Chloroflexi bacterium]|nr:Fatty acid desaturase [Chloroflexota bacterium]
MINLEKSPVATKDLGWREMVAPYKHPNVLISIWQIANTFIPFFVTLFLMFQSLNYSYWLTLALAPLAAGFQLRVFIILHDCGHQSFFKSQKANDILGSICGVISFTAYYHWRHFHALHHATVGDLGRRVEGELLPMTIKKYALNNGDVLTLTLNEYQNLSGWEKLIYRFYRHPVLLFVVAPLLLFMVLHRFANSRASRRERYSVYLTNLAILAMLLALVFTIGLVPLLLVTLPMVILSSTAGVWLFYIQHQFEDTYWEKGKQWNFVVAALKGSSYYKLPLVLQWFTGNIGFHHIHHLNPRIPNYNLQKCHDANPLFQQTDAIGIKVGLRSIFLSLWDEEEKKMIGFSSKRLKALKSTEASQ